jgi:glycosyltransferase involved in cell wall biosynthesis
MKVLHVIPAVALRYGGASRSVIEMCRALREAGSETLIATTDADGHERLNVESGKPVLYEGQPTIFFPRQFSEAFKYSRPLAVWLRGHIGDFDVIHIHAVFSHACIATANACRKKGVPYIVHPIGTLDPWSLKQKRFRKKLFWHLAVKKMLAGAAAIHYTAVPEQKLAEEALGINRGVVIPLGVETNSACQTETTGNPGELHSYLNGGPFVLMLSRLHRKKGLELLLGAFLSISKRSEFKNWRLVLAGDGEPQYVNSLRRLIEKEGGSANVVFTGWIVGTEKQTALQQASLLALTSYQENFGLCVVEALACGTPVIVSPHVNLAPQILQAGAGWVAPLERTSLERTLMEAMQNAHERSLRGAAGRELVRLHFTWSAIAKQLVAVYNSVV